MLRRDPTYRRVKTGGRGAFGSSSYWLGPDHLLVVVVAGYSENYRRFLFADIQAVVVCKTRTRGVLGLALAVLTLLPLVLALSLAGTEPVGAGVALGFAAVFGALLLLNWLQGPTCTASLWTAVQATPLPNISRWSQARRLLQALTPRLAEAQAHLAQNVPNETPAAPIETAVPAPASPTPEASAPGPGPGPKYVVDDPNLPPRILS